MTYLLDANIFIQAKNLHYGLDFCPAFWQWLLDNHAAGRVFSIDKVADEIDAGDDDLKEWMRNHGNSLFVKTGAKVAAQLGAVSHWATQQQYEPAAINTFLQIADYYLIAHALADGHVVVTHEVSANSFKRIKIPNACIGLGLRFMTLIQAKNLHYGLDFCPAFWQWLLDNHAAGRVFSIDKVADEIDAGDDDLKEWMRNHGNSLFVKTGAKVAAQLGAVSHWATQQQYEPAAINTFRTRAQARADTDSRLLLDRPRSGRRACGGHARGVR